MINGSMYPINGITFNIFEAISLAKVAQHPQQNQTILNDKKNKFTLFNYRCQSYVTYLKMVQNPKN